MTAAPALRLERPSGLKRRSAARLERPRHMSLIEAALADPQPNQVRIRLEGCGVCGSNVPVWEGREWFNYPLEAGAPGHEGWGTIEAVGAEVHSLQPGDRVAALTYHAFATHDLAEADQVVRLPRELDGAAFPGEAVGCAMNVFRRSQVRAGETVAVVGVGFLGALLIQLAAGRGARVIAVSRREFSLEVARRCGAQAGLSSTCEGTAEAIQELTCGAGCDCVIEAAGLQEPLDLAGKLVRTRGRLVIAGYHQDGPRSIDLQSWNWRGIDVINAHERDPRVYIQGMREAAQEAAAGQIRLDDLLTHEFSLAEVGEALRLASERPEGFLKAWVHCS